jgi:hypothetical protein
MSQVVEHLPSKLEALSSILNTKKKKKKDLKNGKNMESTIIPKCEWVHSGTPREQWSTGEGRLKG